MDNLVRVNAPLSGASPYPNLFSPFTIGGIRVKNRIAMAMETHLGHADGSISKEQIAYYRERALGGVGLILVEFTCVDPIDGHSGSVPQPILASMAHKSGHAKLAEAVHNAGAKVCVQLSHAGRQTLPEVIGGRTPVAPSAIPSPYFRNHPRALEGHEIERIIASYARAAGLAVAAGYDGVLLHGAHGYLLSQFLSPITNQRDDEWGGDFERRMRFPLAVVKAVKAVIGDRALFYRMGVSDFAEGGLTIEDSEIIAPRLCAAGVDAIDISIASLERLDLMVEPMSVDEGWRLPMARRIREATGKPVICAGQIRWPEMADAAIAAGDTDMISLGRPLLADPQWPNKAAAGRKEDIRPCTSCNWCLLQMFKAQAVGCAENPRCGRETEGPILNFGDGRPAVVVGAGPGGIASALLLDQAGFNVTLFERRSSLGGGIITSATPPGKEKLFWYSDFLAGRVQRSNIACRLGESANAAAVTGLNPSVVFIAAGSKSSELESLPTGTLRIESARDVLMGDAVIEPPDDARPVVIFGGGETGVETAEFLTLRGYQIVLVTRSGADKLARNAESLYRIQMLRRVKNNPAIKIVDHTLLAEIGDSSVTLQTTGQAAFKQPAAILLLAHGFVPDTSLSDALDGVNAKVITIGDARNVARIGEAVRDAYREVMDLQLTMQNPDIIAC